MIMFGGRPLVSTITVLLLLAMSGADAGENEVERVGPMQLPVNFVVLKREAERLHVLDVRAVSDYGPARARGYAPYMSGLLAAEFRAVSGADWVISGGYLQSYDPPTALGFIKVDGVGLSPPHVSELLDGVICRERFGGPAILSVRGWSPDRFERDLERFEDYLQAGPMITGSSSTFLDNPSRINEPTRQYLLERAEPFGFVCITSDDKTLIGVTSPMSMRYFKLAISAPRGRGGLGCDRTLRLTGGPSAILAGPRYQTGPGTKVLQPNVLAIIRRD